MRLNVLACWGVVAALVVAVQGKPYAPPVFDIARAYENYHRLWMAEASRNSVAPVSFSQQVARTWPHNRSAVTRVAPSAPVVDTPPQQQMKAEVQTEKAMVDQKTQQSTTTEMQTEQPTTEMTTEMATEPTTEQAVQTEMTSQMQTQQQTTQQTPTDTRSSNKQTTQQITADTRSASKQTPPQEQVKSVTPTARPSTMKSAFDTFFTRWNAERIRNSIPPVATPIPPLSSSYYKQTVLAKQPVASKFVDRPVETREYTAEANVDTLTQAAAPSAPVPTAAAPPSDAVELIKSLTQSNNWNQQGNTPIIILLHQ